MQVIQTRQSSDSEVEMKTNFRLIKRLRKARGRPDFSRKRELTHFYFHVYSAIDSRRIQSLNKRARRKTLSFTPSEFANFRNPFRTFFLLELRLQNGPSAKGIKVKAMVNSKCLAISGFAIMRSEIYSLCVRSWYRRNCFIKRISNIYPT